MREDFLLRIEFFCLSFIREIVAMKQVTPLRKKRRRNENHFKAPTDSGVPSEGVMGGRVSTRGPEEGVNRVPFVLIRTPVIGPPQSLVS